jgi:hypothetical protein
MTSDGERPSIQNDSDKDACDFPEVCPLGSRGHGVAGGGKWIRTFGLPLTRSWIRAASSTPMTAGAFDNGFATGDRKFESSSLQGRDAMGRAAKMATSSLHQPMECRNAPARSPGPPRDNDRLDAATGQNRATKRPPPPPCWSPARATPTRRHPLGTLRLRRSRHVT